MTENELYHHGILGMKWGVRRYQNEDGSLTSAGKARYGVKDRIGKAAYKVVSSDAYQKTMRGAVNASRKAKSKLRGAKDQIVEKWNGLTPGQKKALKIGAAVAGTALLAYGAYKISGVHYDKLYSQYSKEFETGRKFADDFWNRDSEHFKSMTKGYNPATSYNINVKDSYLSSHFDTANKLEGKMDKTLYSRVNDRLGRANIYEHVDPSKSAPVETGRRYRNYNDGDREWDDRLVTYYPESYKFKRQHIETTARQQKERRKNEK